MKRIAIITLAAAIAGPALADGPTVAVVTPPVIAPVAPAADWSGAYVGLSLGTGSGKLTFNGNQVSPDLDFNSYGVFAGYNYDMGRTVVGGEISYSDLNIDDAPSGFDSSALRVMGRVGYDAGRFMPYATAGFASLKAESNDATGYAYGVGVDALLGNNFVVGAQYIRHQFTDIDNAPSSAEIEANQFEIRAAYKF